MADENGNGGNAAIKALAVLVALLTGALVMVGMKLREIEADASDTREETNRLERNEMREYRLHADDPKPIDWWFCETKTDDAKGTIAVTSCSHDPTMCDGPFGYTCIAATHAWCRTAADGYRQCFFSSQLCMKGRGSEICERAKS